MISSSTIDDAIYHHGFYILDNFLPKPHYENLCLTIQDQHQQGHFKQGKVGRSHDTKLEQRIRSDQIYWLDELTQHPATQAYFIAMNTIRTRLNQALFMGLQQIEAHFAVYNPGNFYKKHVDQFITTQDRRISCVYYLNQNWQPEHGGELVLYDKNNHLLTRVEPRGNRLICFTSDLPHEVTMAHQVRYSIASWLKINK